MLSEYVLSFHGTHLSLFLSLLYYVFIIVALFIFVKHFFIIFYLFILIV